MFDKSSGRDPNVLYFKDLTTVTQLSNLTSSPKEHSKAGFKTVLGPLLVTWINFNPKMGKQFNKFGNGSVIPYPVYNGCNY